LWLKSGLQLYLKNKGPCTFLVLQSLITPFPIDLIIKFHPRKCSLIIIHNLLGSFGRLGSAGNMWSDGYFGTVPEGMFLGQRFFGKNIQTSTLQNVAVESID